jgi:Pyruvate/2-oxoacid:ferredoxin oxidoreductase delta subunit
MANNISLSGSYCIVCSWSKLRLRLRPHFESGLSPLCWEFNFLGVLYGYRSRNHSTNAIGTAIFGVGLGILSIVFQVYFNFLGGLIAALVMMNLTSPLLDKVGIPSSRTTKITPKLPKAKQFATVKTYECIRCGACMRSCCHHLGPILVKQTFDKGNLEAARKLQANFCEGCGHCSYVCPARIDLKGAVLRSKAMLRQQ